MSKLVTISLDEESFVLWKRLEEKSVWVRQKLHEEIFDADLVKHAMSERARTEGSWDGRCNPNNRNKGICGTCWPPDALSVLSVNPHSKMYIPPRLTPSSESKNSEEE